MNLQGKNTKDVPTPILMQGAHGVQQLKVEWMKMEHSTSQACPRRGQIRAQGPVRATGDEDR